MEQRLVDKLIRLAERNPKGLFRASFFAKYCELMGIEIEETEDLIYYSYQGKKTSVVAITNLNCKEYKCVIPQGIKGIRIWEFLKALVYLIKDYEIEPPFDQLTAGKEALYYIEEAKNILQS